ncbi:RUN and FYVE domain-containing protein 2-like isoform X2 [Leguminivora glycinivorella]|uniref:RUN and FYVE domain-containing protein 2-like isoform X2 n=1 Tax=Leguminivora glycinivorella TaxID=1035111 RepID=UPI00200FA412|nr:RUN and FYVE domain-containing protein 2-like isoform X2 [Leguminivora glycinivorella]
MRSLTAVHGHPLPELGVPSSINQGDGSGDDMAGAQDTIYLCNFRVSVDGEWLCLKELQDMEMQDSYIKPAEPGVITSPDDPMHSLMARDPVVIERSNLVNISKLIVKELIEQSLRYGRMLDSDHLPLHHFFIVLEHVMRHGLKPKKGLLGPKKELWDILQMVEKYSPEAADITASVRDLPTVKTAMGRARAWLRLALMQKRLADYMRLLLEHREDTLEEYFEPHALMLNDEAVIITGLLVGLNVVDCNLCVKEEDLDSQQGVIDFSLYLRGSNSSTDLTTTTNNANTEPKQRHINTMLDQKNYIEELNRHLNATVANLQAKVEGLTTTNALMKEDLAIAKNTMITLVEENNQLKHALGQDITKDSRMKVTELQSDEEEKRSVKSVTSDKSKNEKDSEVSRVLEEERKKNVELQRELDLQISLKAEMEVAMKLLEKDIHDKQDTIVSLRRQLDDIKLINLEMYKKLQECESSLKHKTELIAKLEAKTESMGSTIHQLDEKLKEDKAVRTSLEESARSLGQKTAAAETRAVTAEGDLRIEREWRTSLQESMIRDRDKISMLTQEVESLKSIGQKYLALQEEQHLLKTQYSEAQKTLEEVGATLSENKLQLAELLEKEALTASTDDTPNWTSDKDATVCTACAKEFTIARRKHHCRRCGHIFCSACSDKSVALVGNTKPVRVCDACYAEVRLT